MKKTFLSFLCLLLSLFLFACTANSQEAAPSVPPTESEHTDAGNAEQETAAASDIYYRMTYTRSPINIDNVMHTLLTGEAEKTAFDAAKTNVSTLSDGLPFQEGSMTVDGITYQWSECAGLFTFTKGYSAEPIEAQEAEQLARDFLQRLGWEYCDELQIRSLEDGTVDIHCRLSYRGVKLMGLHTLYFEPGNEDERGLSGSCIQLSLSGTGIYSVLIQSGPQDGDILQTYDAQKDFLSPEEAADMAKQYLEIKIKPSLFPGEELLSEKMSLEQIYMPYRDISDGNTDILIPAFEVRIPYQGEDMPDGTLVLYMDALTGYVYDQNFEFF